MESTFRMGSSTIYLSQSETYRNAVAAQYAGTLDLPAFCTALTDGTICEESGLGCDFVSFHTGATNEECRRKALAKGESHEEAATHIQSHDSNAGFVLTQCLFSRFPNFKFASLASSWSHVTAGPSS